MEKLHQLETIAFTTANVQSKESQSPAAFLKICLDMEIKST